MSDQPTATGPAPSAPTPGPVLLTPPTAPAATAGAPNQPAPPATEAAATIKAIPTPWYVKLREGLTIAALLGGLAFGGWYAINHGAVDQGDKPINFVAMGKSAAPDFLKAFGSRLRAGAGEIRAGKSFAQAQAAGVPVFEAGVKSAVEKKLLPALGTLVSSGSEPKDKDEAEAVARALDEIAAGLEGVH